MLCRLDLREENVETDWQNENSRIKKEKKGQNVCDFVGVLEIALYFGSVVSPEAVKEAGIVVI